ncbi:MAG: heavy metal translocating P-type ATPase [bacterium]|jgi:heavy metal translocating P-type ATPase
MKYQVVHQLPNRIRIQLLIPYSVVFEIDSAEIEQELFQLSHVESASFSPQTRTVLIYYDNSAHTHDVILEAIEEMPIPNQSNQNQLEYVVKSKKRKLLLAGLILLSKPIVPLPLQPIIAFCNTFAIMKAGLISLYHRRLNAEVLDFSAVSVALSMSDFTTTNIIAFLLDTGSYLEEQTKQQSRKSLAKMISVNTTRVWIKDGEIERKIHIREVQLNDLVVIRAGARIPIDGFIEEGEASVNQASMTGEPLPVLRRRGAPVYAGTIVEEGNLVIRTTKVGDQTRLAQIIRIIEESEDWKGSIQSTSEGLADRLVLPIFLLSGLTYLLTGNVTQAASVLLVDYSCAIKLSTPLAIMSAMIAASKKGVIIKGGKYIEQLAGVDVFVVDKTGTLTEAKPKVKKVIAFNGFNRDYILQNTACLEEHYPHPIATAVVEKAEEEGLIHEEKHGELTYIAAHGLVSNLEGKQIIVGSHHFVHEDENINIDIAKKEIEELSQQGLSILYVAIDKKIAGIIAIEDPIRPDSVHFLKELASTGIKRIIMMTGDAETTARTVAKKLELTEFEYQVLPERKKELIEELQEQGHCVAMLGDGMNDSPALSYANVGISLPHGADIAKETADVLLINGKLNSIIEGRRISNRAISRVKQNFYYISTVNTSLIFMSMAGVIPPILSALIHNATTILVSANSLRSY